MNGKNAKILFTKTAGFVGGVSAALLLSLPALAQQSSGNSNSNTSPTPAPAAPNTYSPSTGDPTIRVAPGTESNTVDRTQNPNSVQQPAGRTRFEDRSTGNIPNTLDGATSQNTTSTTEQYNTPSQSTNTLQAPAGRSRYDDRSTGFNQANFDRISGVDSDNSTQYGDRSSSGNPARTESRSTETNNSTNETQRNQGNPNVQDPGSTVAPNPDNNQQNKELQSDSPNQQNPNLGSSDGSGAVGNRVDQTNQNNQRTFDQMGGSTQPSSSTQQSTDQTGGRTQPTYGAQQPTESENPGTRTGIEERTQTVDQQQRTNTTVEQQRGNSNVNTTGPSSSGEGSSQGAGGQTGNGDGGVSGLW